jgi:hypothetical protein
MRYFQSGSTVNAKREGPLSAASHEQLGQLSSIAYQTSALQFAVRLYSHVATDISHSGTVSTDPFLGIMTGV